MSGIEIVVLAGTLTAIGWVNWYFFLARRSASTAVAVAGRQEISVVVRGGYEPSTLQVKRGTRVRIVFDRQETSSCSEEVVFPDFGIRKFLPANQQTTIEITPEAVGTHEFTCGMGMLRGKLVVTD